MILDPSKSVCQVAFQSSSVIWTSSRPNYAAARDTVAKLLSVSPRHIDALNRQAEIKLRAGASCR